MLSEETDDRSLTILESRKGNKETGHFPPMVFVYSEVYFDISHISLWREM